jgi:hypothetical protein
MRSGHISHLQRPIDVGGTHIAPTFPMPCRSMTTPSKPALSNRAAR